MREWPAGSEKAPGVMKFSSQVDHRHHNSVIYSSILCMLWIASLVIILFFLWLLFSILEFRIDTRVPVIMMQWQGLGKAVFVYENEEWWLKFRILFFSGKRDVITMIFSSGKKKKKAKKSNKSRSNQSRRFTVSRLFKLMKTFRIVECRIVISDEDETLNARRYWLNFFPLTQQYLHVNFMDDSFLVMVIENRLWRIIYAFIK
ncbi:MAG: hypothetical protein EPN37_05935 [Chitinophagaceae bacterium]|nr:MAG: hypothetical protein EPN37_05935 [Chitinophagaceae bacterium]